MSETFDETNSFLDVFSNDTSAVTSDDDAPSTKISMFDLGVDFCRDSFFFDLKRDSISTISRVA